MKPIAKELLELAIRLIDKDRAHDARRLVADALAALAFDEGFKAGVSRIVDEDVAEE